MNQPSTNNQKLTPQEIAQRRLDRLDANTPINYEPNNAPVDQDDQLSDQSLNQQLGTDDLNKVLNGEVFKKRVHTAIGSTIEINCFIKDGKISGTVKIEMHQTRTAQNVKDGIFEGRDSNGQPVKHQGEIVFKIDGNKNLSNVERIEILNNTINILNIGRHLDHAEEKPVFLRSGANDELLSEKTGLFLLDREPEGHANIDNDYYYKLLEEKARQTNVLSDGSWKMIAKRNDLESDPNKNKFDLAKKLLTLDFGYTLEKVPMIDGKEYVGEPPSFRQKVDSKFESINERIEQKAGIFRKPLQSMLDLSHSMLTFFIPEPTNTCRFDPKKHFSKITIHFWDDGIYANVIGPKQQPVWRASDIDYPNDHPPISKDNPDYSRSKFFLFLGNAEEQRVRIGKDINLLVEGLANDHETCRTGKKLWATSRLVDKMWRICDQQRPKSPPRSESLSPIGVYNAVIDGANWPRIALPGGNIKCCKFTNSFIGLTADRLSIMDSSFKRGQFVFVGSDNKTVAEDVRIMGSSFYKVEMAGGISSGVFEDSSMRHCNLLGMEAFTPTIDAKLNSLGKLYAFWGSVMHEGIINDNQLKEWLTPLSMIVPFRIMQHVYVNKTITLTDIMGKLLESDQIFTPYKEVQKARYGTWRLTKNRVQYAGADNATLIEFMSYFDDDTKWWQLRRMRRPGFVLIRNYSGNEVGRVDNFGGTALGLFSLSRQHLGSKWGVEELGNDGIKLLHRAAKHLDDERIKQDQNSYSTAT